MYAVIKTGGKQYRVAKNDVIVVERLAGEPGAAVELDQVLMLDDGKAPTIGAPLVDGARVAATVLDQSRGEKILVFRKKRRKNYRRTLGHRQEQTVLRITDILAKGEKTAAAKAETAPPAAAETAPEMPAPSDVGAAEAATKPAAKKPAAKKPAAKKKAAPKPKAAAKPKTSSAKSSSAKSGAGKSKEKS